MSRRMLTYISIICFILILIFPTILWVRVGKNSESTLDEKRELQAFPELNLNFFSNFELWYKDHTPYRSVLIEIYNTLSGNLNKIYNDSISPIISTAFAPGWFDKSGGAVYRLPRIENYAIYGLGDWLFYSGDDSIAYFEGTNVLSEEEMEALSIKYKSLDDKCKEKGIDLIYVVPPNKEQVFSEYMPSFNVKTNEKREQVLEKYIKSNSDVNYIYLLDEMLAEKDEYTPYYKQDTHWNSLGAFVGVMAIYKELGYPYLSVDDVDITVTKKYGGDLSSMCGYSSEYDDYSVDYKPDITYEVELIDDGWVERYTSSNRNGKTCVLISDSFRQASKGFIAKDYEYTYVCHRSYLADETIVEAIKNLKEEDLLLIMAVERYDYSNADVTDFVCEVLD